MFSTLSVHLSRCCVERVHVALFLQPQTLVPVGSFVTVHVNEETASTIKETGAELLDHTITRKDIFLVFLAFSRNPIMGAV